MINPFKEVNWNPDRAGKRQFARSLMIGFPILAVAWLIIGKFVSGDWGVQPAIILATGGAILGAVLWAIPGITKPFYLAWYGIACAVGTVISNVLLVSFYLIVMTLFGLLRRTFGRQPVQKTFNKEASSYWLQAERISDPKRYYSQF